MKLTKVLLAAMFVSGSLGATAGFAVAHGVDRISMPELQADRYPTKIEDDQSLAPGVPGVTEQNDSDMTPAEVAAVQEALADLGYDPGRVDGQMDNDTRAAIREFQKEQDVIITGTVDEETAELLGVGWDRRFS